MRHLRGRHRRTDAAADAGPCRGAARPGCAGGQRHADARGARRLCRTLGLAGAHGHDHGARADRDGRRPPHRALLRAAVREPVARRGLFPGDDRRHAGRRRPLHHGTVGRDGDARRPRHRRALRLAPGRDRAPAGPLSLRVDVPGIGGGVRDVPDRPGQQPARCGARPGAGRRRDHVEQLVRFGRRTGRGVVPRRAVGRLPGAAALDHAHPGSSPVRAHAARQARPAQPKGGDRARRIRQRRHAVADVRVAWPRLSPSCRCSASPRCC